MSAGTIQEDFSAVLGRWHAFVDTPRLEILNEILDDDCVFYSPVVFRPQTGKFLTSMYLISAAEVFKGGDFHYISKTCEGPSAVLEFVCTVDGVEINGVDMIQFNEKGLITAFKVMVRPLKAINFLHARMKEMLDQLKQGQGLTI